MKVRRWDAEVFGSFQAPTPNFVFLLWAAADQLNASSCCNLTQTLEKWRSSIMEQVKDLLLLRHHTVLPDYSR